MPFPTNNTLLDDFNRANEDLTTPWESAEIRLAVVSNTVQQTEIGTAGWSHYRWQTVFNANQEAWATIGAKQSDTAWRGVGVRCGAGPSGYVFIHHDTATIDQYSLMRISAGPATTVISGRVTGPELISGNKIGLQAIGTTLTGWVFASGAWTKVIETTDSTYTASGKLGIIIWGIPGPMDDFGGGASVVTNVTTNPIARGGKGSAW